ncbi:MAG: FAD-binding oxidoreductase [Bryobacteraceae bacterium]
MRRLSWSKVGAKWSILLLAPSVQKVPAGARLHRCEAEHYGHYLGELQRLRGKVYLEDGAVQSGELTADGRHQALADLESWHILAADGDGRVCGCARYLPHSNDIPFQELGVARSALARDPVWGEALREAVHAEMALARHLGVPYVEVGGWALGHELRNTTAALHIALSTYALARVLGGCIGVGTVTQRHFSSTILRRIGGGSLRAAGRELPSYYDPAYGCVMEILGFDSRFPDERYRECVAELEASFSSVPIISTPKYKPTEVHPMSRSTPDLAALAQALTKDHETPVDGRLNAACSDWAAAIGAEFVVRDTATLNSAGTATFLTTQSVPAVIRPRDREQVRECLRIAARHGVPVHPVSSGKNWGYGSRVPASDGCVLMDLGRMNRILDFSEDLAYATVEPGVTQRQLLEFLRERKSGLWLDATGASTDCSLIGNVMERGFGHTPYGDHFSYVCGLEVVLPNGEVVDTGFSRFPGAATAAVHRWGFGPSIDGLFSQSSLGIVTRMTIWLMPAPEYFQAFFFRCDEEDGLAPLIDALRPLRLSGVLRSASHIGNDYKVLSGIRQYPWAETGGRTPLMPEQMARFRRELNFGYWNGSGGLYGTRAQVAEARRLVKRALAGKVSRIEFLDDRKLRWAGRVAGPFRLLTGWDLSKTLELLYPVYDLMKGIPTNAPIKSSYWRKKTAPPEDGDPDRDGCGLLWCSPTLPAEGGHATRLMDLVNRTTLSNGFEPIVSITMLTERSMCCVISLSYDRDVPGEDERAMACYKQLVHSLREYGYPPYRLGVQGMSEMDSRTGYGNFIGMLKRTLDPAGILAPGRYQPAASHPIPEPEKVHEKAIAMAAATGELNSHSTKPLVEA